MSKKKSWAIKLQKMRSVTIILWSEEKAIQSPLGDQFERKGPSGLAGLLAVEAVLVRLKAIIFFIYVLAV